MSNAPAILEARDARGRGLRVEFFRRQDRYAHRLWLFAEDDFAGDPRGLDAKAELAWPAWESHEGTDADDWPASPPLQQFSLETLAPGRRAALLVGMAGTSHWSLSVEAEPGAAALLFDVACRLKSAPAWLGSRYAPLPAPPAESAPRAGPEDLALRMGRIEFHPLRAELVLAPGGVVQLAPLELAPLSAAPRPAPPCTLRWSYRAAYVPAARQTLE